MARRESEGRRRLEADLPDLVREYQGSSAPGMRALAARYGVAYATVRTGLLRHGAQLRPRGGEWRRRQREQDVGDGER